MLDFIVNAISSLATWLKDLLESFFLYCYQLLLAGLSNLIDLVPVPDWALNLPQLFIQIPSSVIYFANMFDMGFGMSVVFSALGIRFLIRRLPVIG